MIELDPGRAPIYNDNVQSSRGKSKLLLAQKVSETICHYSTDVSVILFSRVAENDMHKYVIIMHKCFIIQNKGNSHNIMVNNTE